MTDDGPPEWVETLNLAERWHMPPWEIEQIAIERWVERQRVLDAERAKVANRARATQG